MEGGVHTREKGKHNFSHIKGWLNENQGNLKGWMENLNNYFNC